MEAIIFDGFREFSTVLEKIYYVIPKETRFFNVLYVVLYNFN